MTCVACGLPVTRPPGILFARCTNCGGVTDTRREACGLDPVQSTASADVSDEVAEVLRTGRWHDYSPPRVAEVSWLDRPVALAPVLGAALLLTAVGWALAWMIAG